MLMIALYQRVTLKQIQHSTIQTLHCQEKGKEREVMYAAGMLQNVKASGVDGLTEPWIWFACAVTVWIV